MNKFCIFLCVKAIFHSHQSYRGFLINESICVYGALFVWPLQMLKWAQIRRINCLLSLFKHDNIGIIWNNSGTVTVDEWERIYLCSDVSTLTAGTHILVWWRQDNEIIRTNKIFSHLLSYSPTVTRGQICWNSNVFYTLICIMLTAALCHFYCHYVLVFKGRGSSMFRL